MALISADVVVDLQYGDCGKGKVVHSLASTLRYTHVMRFNGGSNAGHTIYHNGKKFVTHLVPAGVFYNTKSLVGGGCVIDVEKFNREISRLEEQGIPASKLTRVASNAHTVQKQHVEEEKSETKIGTTRTGNGPAYRDKHARTGKRAEQVESLEAFMVDVYEELWTGKKDVNVLMEGAQGFGLDVDWGDYPYVSSSTCTVSAAINAGIPPQNINRIIGVAKPYVTYVGAKKFAGSHPSLSKLQKIGQEYGATTGRPRQCNWLNLSELIKAANINGVTEIIFNKCDVFEEVGCFCLYENSSANLSVFTTMHAFKKYLEDKLKANCINLSEVVWSSSPHHI